METIRQRFLTQFSLYFTFFIDNLAWALVLPLFAPLFLDPQNLLFSADVSVAMRTTILGFFLAAFPLAQFFGAPIIGDYADRKGRKKALIYSVLFSLVGLVLGAISLQIKNLFLLFISRLISGVSSGSLSICLSAVADMNQEEKERVKHFGHLAVIAGLSFIIGTFLGGIFSDSTVNKHFTYDLPFWIASGLTLLNLVFVLFYFYETHVEQKNIPFDFLEGVHNIQKALRTEKIKSIYVLYFLFLFSWNILLQFTPVLVVEEFHFSNATIGYLAAFMGVSWAFGSSGMSRIMHKIFSSKKVLEISFIFFTVLSAFLYFPKHIGLLLVMIALIVIFAGVAWPLCTNIISKTAPSNMRGKILGMSQSMQSLAMTLSPLSAVFTHIHESTPFLVAALASFAAAILYFRAKI